MLNKKVLPISDFPAAAIHATLLLLLLVSIGYPVEEWAVTGAVLYLFFRVSLEIVVALTLGVSRSLLRYGERVARRLPAATPANRTAAENRAGLAFAFAIGVLLTGAALGLGLGSGAWAVSNLGMTPLPEYFLPVAGILAAIGVGGLGGIFGLFAAVFYSAANPPATARPKFDRFQETARTSSRLRRGKLIPVGPAIG